MRRDREYYDANGVESGCRSFQRRRRGTIAYYKIQVKKERPQYSCNFKECVKAQAYKHTQKGQKKCAEGSLTFGANLVDPKLSTVMVDRAVYVAVSVQLAIPRPLVAGSLCRAANHRSLETGSVAFQLA